MVSSRAPPSLFIDKNTGKATFCPLSQREKARVKAIYMYLYQRATILADDTDTTVQDLPVVADRHRSRTDSFSIGQSLRVSLMLPAATCGRYHGSSMRTSQGFQ